jgi:hypothetical protein
LAKYGTDGTVLYDRLPEGSMDSPDFKQFELMVVHRLPALYRYALTLTGSTRR